VTVHGVGMGLVTYTGRARVGAHGMRGDGVGVGDIGEVRVTHGIRGTRRVTMTVGERGGSVTQGWSVDVGA
jgi:hypothetical protein